MEHAIQLSVTKCAEGRAFSEQTYNAFVAHPTLLDSCSCGEIDLDCQQFADSDTTSMLPYVFRQR